jgi:hypothetical protein
MTSDNSILLRRISAVTVILIMIGGMTKTTFAQDFSTINSDSLKSLLHLTTKNLNKIILEIGKTNRPEFINPLITFLQTNNKLAAQIKWSTHLALARLGEPNAVSYVLQRTTKLGMNDDVVYELFPGLVYTRQRQAFEYMIETIKRDDKNCKSADAENPEPINCAFRVLELLAPLIKDFPLKIDASGDLEVTDYAIALQQARKWFASNPQYQIIN